jgi:hypothetical protein
MKTILDKSANSPGAAREQGAASRPPRSRAKKRAALFATTDFWRAISDAAMASPHAPIARLRD